MIWWTNQVSGFAALGNCDFVECSLHLLDVQGAALDLDGRLEDVLDLLQLIGVACDEVDCAESRRRGHI